jgi:hypothetical protein
MTSGVLKIDSSIEFWFIIALGVGSFVFSSDSGFSSTLTSSVRGFSSIS